MSDTTSPIESLPTPESSGSGVVPASAVHEAKPVARPAPDPTRYGDWEKNGRCIDF
ncbi:MAG: DUF1674 domain-containing protein [Dyella sp.]